MTLLASDDFADALIRKKYEEIGCVASFGMLRQGSRRDLHGRLSEWIIPAIELRQIKIFFDVAGRPIGFFTWAFLAEDVASEIKCGRMPSHLSEWNEGDELWIIDLFLIGKGIREVYDFIKRRFSADHSEFSWLTRRGHVRRKSIRKAPGT